MKKFLTLLVLMASYLIITPGAKADTYFTAWFDILNDPTFGYHDAQYAPSTLNLVAFSYSYTDQSNTKFRFDCTSDGNYEIESSAPINPSYAYDGKGQGYFVSGGNYWRYNDPRSDKPAYWASVSGLKCYYPIPGNYTITMLAERGGVQSAFKKSFSIRESAVDMVAKPLYRNDIIEDVYPNSDVEIGKGGQNINNIPQPPATIDFGVSIWNPLPDFPLKLSNGAIKFDCDGDGAYEKTDSYPRRATFEQVDKFCRYFNPWGGSCLNSFDGELSYYSGACQYSKPGIYRANIRAELNREGAPPYVRETSVEFPVVSKNLATVRFTTGGDSAQSAAPLKGVDLKLEAANIIWTHASYNFNCGNGQAISNSVKADFTKKYYDQDYSVSLKDFCNYDTPGEYIAKVQAEFRTLNFPGGIDLIRNILPFTLVSRSSDSVTYSLEKQIKILVTGKVSDTEYIVTSPYDLKWDASRVNSCSASGVGNFFSTSGGGTKTVSVFNPPGDYSYKLTCNSSSGVTVDKTIKVKVITP